ncbi:hypothetical protein GG344DRAFT_69261 [Lentinula edodes]|nr:hypothetical protein GG344DRAFT_69261 [Lentinula edodes]
MVAGRLYRRFGIIEFTQVFYVLSVIDFEIQSRREELKIQAQGQFRGDIRHQRNSEGGIEEVLGRRAWIILVHNVEKTWNMRIRHIWLQVGTHFIVPMAYVAEWADSSLDTPSITRLASGALHTRRNIVALYIRTILSQVKFSLQPFAVSLINPSEFKRILSYLYRDIKAASIADVTTLLLQIPRVVYRLKLEICILLLSVLLLTSLSRALKKRVNVCARVCTQVIVDPWKVDLEALEFAPQSTCIADIEAAFLRILYSPAQHSQAINIPQTSVVQVGALNTIGSTTLYNPPFCAFFHCPLIALVCFLKYSMVPLLVSALGLDDNSSEHDSLPPMFIFSLIFGTIYTFALLAVAVIWALFAYHHLPTVEDICSNIVKDINLFVSS